MLHYHRNDHAGPQETLKGVSGVTPTILTFSSLKEHLAALRALGGPLGIVDTTVTKVGESEQGKDIHAIRIGKNPAMPVLIAGCHHAREWISVEMPILLADFFVKNYAADASVRRIVDARDIWIVPMVNPDGHEHSVLHNRLWRKNAPTDSSRESVDLNRNYATTTWAVDGFASTTKTSDIYKGPSPGYAREVVVMQNLVKDKQFKGTLDYHAKGRFVLFSWAGRTDPPPDAFQQEMAGHLERVIDARGVEYVKVQKKDFYMVLAGISAAESRIPGDFTDYVLEQVSGAISVTIELEPSRGDPRGFILPESEIEPTFKLHKGAALTFLNCIGTITNPPETRSMVLTEGAENNLIAFQPDCWRAFNKY